ncbi:MAG TPA: sodium:solute symporter [Acidobacteriota bacterium]|nr:sodium:solute symporter [Acidobacteriota bacterium]
MRTLDWLVLIAFIAFTVIYSLIRGRGSKTTRAYMLADKTMPWYAVALSIMATQASAITFVSIPGQAYADGTRFVQYYFGLPIAMVILCIVAVPLFMRLNVYTAYEFLEKRFDLKTRVLAGFLFLLQRGLANSISLYAPAIILSIILGWDMKTTLRTIGGIVIFYTALGGVKGINWTEFYQFMIVFAGMFAALFMTIYLLPGQISFGDAVSVAGALGRLNTIDFSFDWNNRYNFWSGIIGGLFLALAYFGTDQSQVQRYLTAKSVAQSRLGLIFNGLAKVPMQFFILFVGVMVFVFYQFVTPPLFFNPVEESKIRSSAYASQYHKLEKRYNQASAAKRQRLEQYVSARRSENPAALKQAREELLQAQSEASLVRQEAIGVLRKNDPDVNTNDTNYVFLTFVVQYLPAGLVGLVIVVVFGATMASNSSELNSLATASVVDVYKRLINRDGSDRHYLIITKIATALWGLFAITVSERASRLGTLVEAVNILGSLFYGTVLGIFMLAFFFKRIGGTSAFLAALVGEAVVLSLFLFTKISFLWYNVFGCVAVIIAAILLQSFTRKKYV